MDQLIKEKTAALLQEVKFSKPWATRLCYDPQCLERDRPYNYAEESSGSTRERMDRMIPAPSQTQLQKLLREDKKLFVTVEIDPDIFFGKINYYGAVYDISVDREGLRLLDGFTVFQKYEEALEEALENALIYVKEKNL